MPIKIGLIGKTNTGKTTFFNSSTLSTEEISTYPFTTKKPSISVGHAITLCVHKEFNVKDNPNNSKGSPTAFGTFRLETRNWKLETRIPNAMLPRKDSWE